MKPLLKWAGGKSWLADHIKQIYESSQHNGEWCEPFVGAGSVVLTIQPKVALLNDLNPHLIGFFQHIKAGSFHPIEINHLENNPDYYRLARVRFNQLIADLDRAGAPLTGLLFWYLNRTCFNGLCRFNRAGQFNVGYGKYKSIDYRAMAEQFPAHKKVMERWTFRAGDFSAVQPAPGSFLYCDPPYDAGFTGYNGGGFSWADQERLVAWALPHDGPVILSNLATPRIIELYKKSGFTIKLLDAPRRISCNGDRTPVKEVLAWRLP